MTRSQRAMEEKKLQVVSTKIILPKPGKFIPTPGYSILSDTEKQKRNKELAEKNRLALQSLRKECKVVLTPVDDCSASQKEDSEGNSAENVIEKEIDYTSSKQEQEEVTVISSDKAMERGNDEEMLVDLEQEASDNMSQKKEDSRINAETENDEVSQKEDEIEVTQTELQSMESNDVPEKAEENTLLTGQEEELQSMGSNDVQEKEEENRLLTRKEEDIESMVTNDVPEKAEENTLLNGQEEELQSMGSNDVPEKAEENTLLTGQEEELQSMGSNDVPEKAEENTLLTGQEEELQSMRSNDVQEKAVENRLLTGQEVLGEIFIMDIVPPTPKQRIKNKNRQLLDWGKNRENTSVTMEDINIQEERVSNLKAIVNSFSATAENKLEMDMMIQNIVQARSKESEGAMEVRSFYGLNNTERSKMNMLSSLAVEGERLRM